MAETKTINLEVETNLGSLKSQLRQAQAEVAAMADKFGVTSEQAALAAKKAAELKDRIADAKDLTDAFNPDAKFNALSRSIGGALDGFQAFEGALGLVGVESESLQKTLLKVQSAMALSQGIQGALEAKDSFIQLGSVVKNAFMGMTTASKIFMTTGILALVGVVVYLTTEVKAVTRAFEDFTDWLGFTDNAAKRTAKAIEDSNKKIAASNDRMVESNKRRADSTAAMYDHEIRMAAIAGKDTTKLEIEKSQKLSQQAQERYNIALDEYNKLQGQNTKAATERRRQLKEQLETERNFIKAERYAREEARAQDAADRREEALRLKEERAKEKKEEIDLNALGEFTKLETQKASIDKTLKFQELEKQGLVGVQEVRENIWKREQEIAAAKKKAQEDALTATADTLGQISDLFGEQTAVGKVAAIAQATISTYLSAQKAYDSTIGVPVVGPVLAPINAGLAIAAGIKNIKAITAVQTPNGGGGGGGNISNSFSGSAAQAPNFNVVGNSGFNQLAQIQQQPIQAYVVSGEVTSAQALDRNRVKNATL
jgi:hypothetical protein